MRPAPKAPYVEGVRDSTCPGAGPGPGVGSCGRRGSGIGLARRFGGCVSLQFWVGMCTVGGEDGVGVSAPTGRGRICGVWVWSAHVCPRELVFYE